MGTLRNVLQRKQIVTALQVLVIVFLVIYGIGILGYRYVYGMDTLDAVYTATLSLTDASSAVQVATTTGQQLFASFYTLAANLFLLALVSSIVALIFSQYVDALTRADREREEEERELEKTTWT